MEIFALCVINAFLVEEAEHHLETDGSSASPLSDRSNPLTSPESFITKKIDFLAKHKNALPFTYAIATCPLIIGLIEPKSYAVNNFSTLLFGDEGETNKNEVQKLLCSEKHWELINRSFIAGRCKNTPVSRTKKPELNNNGAA